MLHSECIEPLKVINENLVRSEDCLDGLVVRAPGYGTEIYCPSCEVRTEFIGYLEESRPPLWSSGLVVRVPGYRTGMYCASCEVRTQFIYVM
jgi:hypothetical protein